MASTPDEWLPILTKKLDERAPKTQRLRSYCDGNAPLPEMGANVRASWEAFQKKARVNYGGLATGALKARIRPRGVKVGDGTDETVLAAVERIWRDNRLATQFGQAIRDRLEVGVGYLVIGRNDGHAVVTREKPELFIASTDPLQPWKARAALKVWRDDDLRQDLAYVWATGQRQRYARESRDAARRLLGRAAGEWTKTGGPETYIGSPPVIVLERPDGRSLIEEYLDLIDGTNLAKLHRLVITAMQAFRQRGIKGDLPLEDGDGNSIDWAKVFEPAPGALWDLPGGIDVWESEQTDIRPLLEGEKADRRDFAAVTQTPISVFVPEGENQSAEGAMNAQKGHVSLAEDEIADLKPGLAVAVVYALAAEHVDLAGQTVDVDFAPPALVSLADRYAAAVQAQAAGLARRTILRDVLGMTPDEIRQDDADLASDQLSALTLATTASDSTAISAASAADAKTRADAMGTLIRAGVTPEDAARQSGLNGVRFVPGATPVTLRIPGDTATGR